MTFAYIVTMDTASDPPGRRETTRGLAAPTLSDGRYSMVDPGQCENPYQRPVKEPRAPATAGPRVQTTVGAHPPRPPATHVEHAERASSEPPTDSPDLDEAEPLPLVNPKPTVVGARLARSRTRAFARTLPFLSAHGDLDITPAPSTIAGPFFVPTLAPPLVSEPLPPPAELADDPFVVKGLYLHPDAIEVEVEPAHPHARWTSSRGLFAVLALSVAAVLLAFATARLFPMVPPRGDR